VPTIPVGGMIFETYRITRGSDCRAGEAGGCEVMAAIDGQTPVTEHPWNLHVLQEVHPRIRRHRQAIYPTDGRKVHIPVVHRRSRFLVSEEVTLSCTRSRVSATRYDVHCQHGRKQGWDRSTVPFTGWGGTSGGLLQQDSIQG
jgi:hypothetical protein